MDKELKAKWVAALRSGQYQQGKTFLKQDGRYCCLGVLCEVASFSSDSCAFITKGGYNEYALLPIKTQEDLGVMNDRGQSFAQIADYIETHL